MKPQQLFCSSKGEGLSLHLEMMSWSLHLALGGITFHKGGNGYLKSLPYFDWLTGAIVGA